MSASLAPLPCPGCGEALGARYGPEPRVCWPCWVVRQGGDRSMPPPASNGEPLLLAVDAESREGPFARTLPEFVALKSDTPPALIGDDQEILLPAAGFGMLGAKGGKGKTTLTVDAAFHLATGIDWLGFTVPRPIRILFIENEGPRELFRRKLEAKRLAWQPELPGDAIHVYDQDWAAFTLTAGAERLRTYIAEHRIELVIGDPLDSLGMRGVGSPEDTREFLKLLNLTGLGSDVAFWLPHHARKEDAEDELDEISGAWGGRIDTLLMLAKLDGNRARLSFPKIRWSRRGQRSAMILAFDPGPEGYSVVGEEGPEERDLAAEIERLLADGEPRTPQEIAAPKSDKRPGIGANRNTVTETLQANPEAFVSRSGKDVGRSPRSTVWLLVRAAEPVEPVGGSQGTGDATGLLAPAPIGASRPEPVPSQSPPVRFAEPDHLEPIAPETAEQERVEEHESLLHAIKDEFNATVFGDAEYEEYVAARNWTPGSISWGTPKDDE